jgi:choline dehydrogenase-like flavoprotein
MFVDAQTLPADEKLAFDLCIVGAGAAGITLARSLAGPGRRVALVESGGLTFDQAIQDLNIGESVGLPYAIADSRLRYFGGTTNHWAGSCRPLDEIDFTERDWVPNSGWPFPRTVLEPFYRRARPICEVPPMPEGPLDPRRLGIDPVPWSAPLETGLWQGSPPTRFGEKYRAALADATGLTVLLNATLLGLDPSPASTDVATARFGTLAGGRFSVTAQRYVLACGGIENARLLLLTACEAWPSGVGNHHDIVGRFFMDHPEISLGVLVHTRPPRPGFTHWFRTATGLFYEGFRLSDAAQRDYRTGNIGYFPLTVNESPSALTAKAPLGAPIQDMVSRLAGASPAGPRVATNMWVTWEPSPDPDSRITLAEKRDAFGLRRLRLDWRLGALDRHNVATAVRVLAREAGRQRVGRLWLAPALRDLDVHDAATVRFDTPVPGIRNVHQRETVLRWACHHMGTTRMHGDARRGVVDTDGRVHGLSNLYVAGSSVFSTPGFSNPTLTIVALALRLADHLATGG